MRVGSLFSGIGGFDLGFERAGMTCVWQAEKDKYANQVLAHHWPNVKRYEDVKDVGRDAEPIDLLCGGFPCQDLSVAGKRAGLAGERSGLWFEFARIIDELKPRWVVIENVPGLLSSNGGRDFSVLLGGLAQLGYGWAYRVLDSQYYGVAQRRRRVFIVANLGDATAPAKVLFEPETGSSTNGGSTEITQGNQQGQRVYKTSGKSITLSGQTGGWGAKTGLYLVEDGVRRLTPTECERLQGFPDGWTENQSDAQRYRQMGNAVTVPVIEWLGKRIMEQV